jgi:DNA-binding SARP family transcriptional activator
MAMGRLRLTLLGGFQARLGPGPVLRLRTRQTQALLAYLALSGGRAHARDALASLLWGHLSQDEARGRLRQALFALRRALASASPSCLVIDGDTLAVDAAAVEVDALVFEELVREGAPAALERAASLYRGDLLQGLPAQGPRESAFEEWLGAERERLRELALEALARLVTVLREAGAPERALATALRLLALDPLQEAVHRTVMRLQVQLGRRTGALRQYQACVNLLRRELGVEPEEETRRLYRDVLGRRPIAGVIEPGLRAAGSSAFTAPDGVALVGREEETASFRSWLARVSSGSAQVAFLVGETGVGKSRLMGELAAEAHAAGRDGGAGRVRVLAGRCHEGEQGLAFGLWLDALRSAGLHGDRTLRDSLEPVWRAELARLLPELGGSDVPVSSHPPDALRLFESVRQLLGHLVRESAVAILLEDLHWADEMSLRLLQFLARRARGWPLLLVGTLREEELPDLPLLGQTLESLEGEPHVERFRVAPLSRRATLGLVRALSSASSEPAALDRIGQEMWRVSAGNPFVVVETMRALQQGIESGPPGALPLAERVRRVIARRLDRLSEVARDLAAAGAVIGRAFEFSLLQCAAGRDEATTAAGVEELVRRQVLHEIGGEFDFVHERVRGAIYTALLDPRRRLLHRQVAAGIEALHAGDLDRHCLALAVHYREGEVWERAAVHFMQAGLLALDRSAAVEAVTCFEQALDAVNRLPRTAAALRQGIDIRIALRYPLSRLGLVARLGTLLEEAAGMASRLGDRGREALVASGRCHYLYSVGDNARARAAGARAVSLARDVEDRELEGEASYYAGLTLMALGRYHGASRPIRDLVDRLERTPPSARPARWSAGHALACSFLARCLAEVGEFPEAFAFGEQGLARAEAVGNPFHLAAACFGLGTAHLRKGDLPDAIAQLGRALALMEAHGIDIFLPGASAYLGLARAWSGHATDGLGLLERALRRARSLNLSAGWARFMTHRGEAHLLAGQLADARRCAEAALERARAHGERGHEAMALRLLGDVLARDGRDPRLAQPLYREALARARDLGMRPLVALCHLSLGEIVSARDASPSAAMHQARAVEMLQQMDMSFWLRSATDRLGAGSASVT